MSEHDGPDHRDAGSVLDADERAELEWLRTENALLRTERDILARVATGLAEDTNAALLRRATWWTPPWRRRVHPTTRTHTMTTPERVWLTRDAYERLSDELDTLLAQAGQADGSDDGAVEARRRAERIRQLRELLPHAVVGEAPPDDGIAEPGMVLTVRFDDDPETETFLLGVLDGTDSDELEVCSPESPLGQALIGASQGEERSYDVPSGRTVRVTLVRAVPYGQHTP